MGTTPVVEAPLRPVVATGALLGLPIVRGLVCMDTKLYGHVGASAK